MEKEWEGIEEGQKAKIYIDLFRATLKRVPNWKTPGNDSIHVYWF